MISYQNHSPYFGCFQDSLIGSAELTRSDIVVDKWHAMQLFGNINCLSERRLETFNFDRNTYTGRQLVSKFIPKINYPKKKSKIYLPQYAPYIKYDADETHVQINRGELISGTLDKSTVGQKVMGSIFHVINNEYGADTALTTIYNFHQIVSRFFLWRGFTVGIADINISENAMLQIKTKTAAMKSDAANITDMLNRRELIAPIGLSLLEFYEMEQLNALEPADNFVTPILNDINFHDNKIARLIFTGSKGNESNLININGSYGQITINGSRPPRNFSWGRTSPYFLRYDTSPESLGFIDTSYREGVRSHVFPYAAADARYSSISNALSTSVSGYQNKISIKNLESILTNNLRQAVKGENIIQMLYADSGIDPRKSEAVKFLTALISDEEMEELYHATPKMFDKSFHATETKIALENEYKQLLEDRQMYRDIYLWAENNNPGQLLIDNTIQMSINPYRIIEDVIYNYADIVDKLPIADRILDPIKTINKVKTLCNTIGYGYYNVHCEERNIALPEHIKKSITLLNILIRTYLSTANLVRKGITNYHVDIIINKIKITFKNSLIDYGLAVGIIAAQCLSEPLTQYVLDSKHRGGGGGGTKFSVVDRIREILGGRDSDKMKQMSMLIMVKQEYEKSKIKVQEIANYIEMMNFEKFVVTETVFYEEYGNPVHPLYTHEKKIIQDFEKYNTGIKRSSNLSKWCIRYELDKKEMMINNMKLDTIIIKLRMKFPEMFIVYSPESSDTIILRCYIAQSMIKIPAIGFTENIIFEIAKKINNTVIRGIKNITYAKVESIAQSEINPDGSITPTKIWAITTVGSNLEEVIENPYVDKYRTQTNSIKEFESMYGIEATREKIIREIRKAMNSGDVIIPHTSLFASEMTYSGTVTSIQKTGLSIREANNITLRLSFQAPIQVIEDAAINNITDEIGGISGSLCVGETPSIGSTYNNVAIDEEFIREFISDRQKNIEDEL